VLVAETSIGRVFAGHVDVFGPVPTAGWFFCGWVEQRFIDMAGRSQLIARFGTGELRGVSHIAFYDRVGLGDRGAGFVACIEGALPSMGELSELAFHLGDLEVAVTPSGHQAPVDCDTLSAALMPLLVGSRPAASKTALQSLLLSALGSRGIIDLVGYDEGLEGWVLLGWTGVAPNDATGTCRLTDANGSTRRVDTHLMGYARPEMECDSTGLLLFVKDTAHTLAWPFQIEMGRGSNARRITGSGQSRFVTSIEARNGAALAVKKALSKSPATQHFAKVLGIAFPESAARPAMATAYIDAYGYHMASSGWIFAGWIPLYPEAARRVLEVTATALVHFAAGPASGAAVIGYYHRADLKDAGFGIILHVSVSRSVGKIASVDLAIGKDLFQCLIGEDTKQIPDQELSRRMRALVESAHASPQRRSLIGILDRRGFFGEDTSGELAAHVVIEIDEAIRCGEQGVLLMGWLATRPNAITALRLRSGPASVLLNPDRFIHIPRQDVVDALQAQFDIPDNRCGFIIFVDSVLVNDAPTYLEIETTFGSVGFKKLPAFRLSGMAAMRHILERVSLQYDAVVPALNHTIGPAIQALNRERLRTKPNVTITQFHTPPEAPKLSVIVPLYGRADFLEYQLGLFSAHPGWQAIDLIYVLDDPRLRHEIDVLAESVASRFSIPFRVLALDRNVGFAPANNVGLAHARGDFICYLNSDVFPGTQDAMERLVARLEADPMLGAVGPLLVYEDGSVQHQGMEFKPVRMAGDMLFPLHSRKGRRPEPRIDLARVVDITGACMVMRRALAERLGGFDPDYVIGDFEDVDLCRKIQAEGLDCAVDHGVHLFHLERKSQIGPGQMWRHNLTLCNAWVFHRRWIWADDDHG